MTRPKLILSRQSASDEGTLGILVGDGNDGFPLGLELHTIELPWRDNQPYKSCIPAGSYVARPSESPRFGKCVRICNVPGRRNILMHAGNFAGDREMGCKTDSHGCILPGLRSGKIGAQTAVLSSRDAFRKLMQWFGARAADLVIIEG